MNYKWQIQHGPCRSVIKHKETGEYFHLFNRRDFSYAIRRFEKGGFSVVERDTKNERQYAEIWERYEFIKKSPYEPVTGNEVDVAFWKDYFNSL
jgi:hypothetical protein